jgi:LysR family glycine cleavage system transcriptional activator
MRIPPLKAIIAFESVARTKSVNRAADELGLTPSGVSHQIANLESNIGRPLVTRLGRGLVLTPTGQQYLCDITGSLVDLSRATERASSESGVEILRILLRIHSSPSFGLMWLLPRLLHSMKQTATFS